MDLVAMSPGDLGLQLFDLGRVKLDHFARANVHEVIVMLLAWLFVACAACAEGVALDDADAAPVVVAPSACWLLRRALTSAKQCVM